MNFEGKVAFVTGASRGIGEYIAYEFAKLGADVAIMAKSTNESRHRVFEGTIEETAENVEKLGARVLAVRGDVSHEDDVRAAYEATMSEFGRCDILVNNAAVSYVGPFLELTVKRWQILLNVNVLGPVMLSQAFLPQMLERGDGRIVNVSSGAGRLVEAPTNAPPPNVEAAESIGGDATFGDAGQGLGDSLLAYGTSKAALNRFTVGLAQEMRGKGVGVNSIDVGAATPAFKYTLPGADYSMFEHSEAPAQLVCWIASQPAEVSGHLYHQEPMMTDLRAQGIVRPKVDPS
ncbi:MAG TPA: SDR family NAD(P)-dependent oxidoreductase [Acidimicrobiia bacterium]|nr:SDR family NAD(P)-dependent oxidoreductase [Acidimicrobiia bacterium]